MSVVEKPSIPDVLSGKHIRDRFLTLTNENFVGHQDRFFGMFAFYLSYIPIVNLTLGYAFAYMHKALTSRLDDRKETHEQSKAANPMQKTVNFIFTELICGVVSAALSSFFTKVCHFDNNVKNSGIRTIQLALGSALLTGLALAVTVGTGGAAIGVLAGLTALGWVTGIVAVAIENKLLKDDLNKAYQDLSEADDYKRKLLGLQKEMYKYHQQGAWRNPWRAFFQLRSGRSVPPERYNPLDMCNVTADCRQDGGAKRLGRVRFEPEAEVFEIQNAGNDSDPSNSQEVEITEKSLKLDDSKNNRKNDNNDTSTLTSQQALESNIGSRHHKHSVSSKKAVKHSETTPNKNQR